MDIDLDRARREAKARLAAARRGELTLRADRAPRLTDAQHAVAVELGERSWPALVARAEAQAILADALAGRPLRRVRPAAIVRARTLGEEELLRAATSEVAYALLELGVVPDARDEDGATPLHRAAQAGRLDVVDALVGWVTVDRSARDTRGRTPLEVATDPAVRAVLTSVTTPREQLASGHGEAAWRADARLLTLLSRSALAAVRHLEDGLAVRTGLPDNARNGVVCDAASPAEIAATLAWLGDAPAVWLVGPDSLIGGALERAGCRPERTAVHMAAPVAALDPGDAPREIVDEAALAAAYGRDDPAEVALLASLGFDGPLRHFTSSQSNAFATTATADGVCTLVELWVAPSARRRGVGTALALGAFAASGAELAVLAPTPATVPFFERLGFALEAYLPDRVFYTG